VNLQAVPALEIHLRGKRSARLSVMLRMEGHCREVTVNLGPLSSGHAAYDPARVHPVLPRWNSWAHWKSETAS